MASLARLITVLDYQSGTEALALARQLDPTKTQVKVGNELFTAAGPALIEQLQALGFNVFLDLKYHDIPNTVAGGVRSAVALGVWMLNVHASGGNQMMCAAREAASSKETLLIGVTVLTSMTQDDLQATGVSRPLAEHVLALAQQTQACKLDGVVCSPLEASKLRATCGDDFLLVTPGIRPAGFEHADQRRVMTPYDALLAGSDYLVIGRPITQAPDPLQACEAIIASFPR